MAIEQSKWLSFAGEIAPMGWQLADALPFGFAAGGGPMYWICQGSSLAGESLREAYTSADGAFELQALYRRHPETRSLIVELGLKNRKPQASSPISLLEPLRLSWSAEEGAAYARTMAGGTSEKVYPPQAFRLDTVRLDRGGSHHGEGGCDGRSSDRDLPLLVAVTGEIDGAVVVGLEWSGYWSGSISRPSSREFQAQIKIPVKDLVLQGGETLALPAAHYVFSGGGLDGASNALRRHLNANVLPKLGGRSPLPTISYNNRFGLGSNVNEALMLQLADAAAKAQVEYFVVDAFEAGEGNLERIDTQKFPRGLKPLADRVRNKGMGLGLWFELERAHRQSDWVKLHPEWFIDIGGPTLHLNLASTEAQDACIALLTRAVRELGLKWLKLDYNIGPKPYWDHLDPSGKIQFAYLEGLYRVLDETLRQCPGVIMECCASGGRRIDLGMLKRAHVAWLSDETTSSENVRFIQCGANYFLPGQLNNECLPFGRSEGLTSFRDYDVACRMLGSLSFQGDLTLLSDDDLARLGRMAEMFKTYRHLLGEDFYPLLPQPHGEVEWEAVEFCAQDAHEAVLFAFSGRGEGRGREEQSDPKPMLRLKGLRANAKYLVRRLGGATTLTKTGEELMHEGLQAPLGACAFAAWHVEVAGNLERERELEAAVQASYGPAKLGAN